jgi:hypothetical protein
VEPLENILLLVEGRVLLNWKTVWAPGVQHHDDLEYKRFNK